MTDDPKGMRREAYTAAREPFFRAPWPPLLITGLIIGLYALQRRAGPELLERLAFSPVKLETGDWTSLITAQFLHGGWDHALVNAFMGLAVGAGTARYFGLTARGVAGFFIFYLVSGVVGFVGLALVHAGDPVVAVGASGSVSGLMGAAGRLLGGDGRTLGPLASRRVIGFSVGLLIVNLLLAVFGAPGSGAPIAWEAHLAGFAFGLVTIGLFGALFRPPNRVTD